MDYGFTHQGKVVTPNGTTGIAAETNDDRNRAIEQTVIARWREQPDTQIAYYRFPAETGGGPYRPAFRPNLGREAGTIATVTTWMGTFLGEIVKATVYRHNFGGRFVSLTVQGTNGAIYHGRASWDGGSVIVLRKAKGQGKGKG